MALFRPDELGPWPDLTSTDAPAGWQSWLHQALQVSGFAAALEHASPVLSGRLDAALQGKLSQPDLRRVVIAVMRYLMRASTRATPYGLFAGVAPAAADRTAKVRVGTAHRPVARMRAAWVADVLDQLEADERVRRHVLLQANNLLVARGEHLVLEHRASHAPEGAPVHLRIRGTAVIRAALALAADPIRWSDLSGKISAESGASTAVADRLIAQLVSQRLLLTDLRPPSIATDPLARLVDRLEALLAEGADVDEWLARLRQVRDQRSSHDRSLGRDTAPHRRELDAAAMTVATTGPRVAVDVRVDCDLVLPEVVTAEACRAAEALTRLARPTTIGWRDWHSRFLDRYGPHALVPVRDVVDADVGLGYPAGFTGAPPAAPPPISDRDRALLALAQRAALHREQEIVLTDAALNTIAGPVPDDVRPSAELTVRVHAPTLAALADGIFQMSVARACGHAFMSTGRFLDLLDETDLQKMTAAARGSAPAATLPVQLSAVTRYTVSLDVARAAQLLPVIIPVGEFHRTTSNVIGLDDIAVTADAHRLYLVSRSRRCALQPMPVNAVEPVRHALPIARFLAEAPVAFATPCSPFEWGSAARDLPFLPALRHGRTFLSPARWLLHAADLAGREADWADWEHKLNEWRHATGCPARVSMGIGDQTIGLDLDEPAHRALLRDDLIRNSRAHLRAVPVDDGWIDGHPHEIVIPLAAARPKPSKPRITSHVVDVREHGTLPGGGHRYLKVYARLEQQTTILTDHLSVLLDQLPPSGTWWYQRYTDPDPHLRLRIAGVSAAAITAWGRQLVEADLTRRILWDTDFPEPGRFGSPAAYAAVAASFTADSAAALAQLATAGHRHGPDWRALAAASMVDLAAAVIGDAHEAMRWIVTHTRAHQPAPERTVYDTAIALANPYDRGALVALPDGEDVLTRWEERQHVLATWRDALPSISAIAPVDLLPDLLHLHHVRITGPDLESERACLHLARAGALSWTTRSHP
ncbi:lantibiotic dehydratase [Jiangella muralis]|uniref:lantibiotic dehydratase n=1 Tax=Jiangella muralis TaxID=702383 RepID=UPI001969CD8B|nr:lantibiotic dehydratase [Jiangella muralis]